MKVLVLGASGFIGKHLIHALRARGDDAVEASLRNPAAAANAAVACDAVVNLAGEFVAQRWSARVKQRIEYSRVDAPRTFLDELSRLSARPSVYVSSSAVGYYGRSETATFDEASPPGEDFLARVCIGWEAGAMRAGDLGMRVSIVRTGVVLGTDGGALARLLPAFRLGAGGIVGNGRQWLSWIHIDDAVAIFLLALDRATGTINATAPEPKTNAEFTRALGKALGRPTVLPVPAFAIRALLGEGEYVLLEGQRVLPKRVTQEYGYVFAFPQLDEALQNLLAA